MFGFVLGMGWRLHYLAWKEEQYTLRDQEAELLKVCSKSWWIWWTLQDGCVFKLQGSFHELFCHDNGRSVAPVFSNSRYVVWDFLQWSSDYIVKAISIHELYHYTKKLQHIFDSNDLGPQSEMKNKFVLVRSWFEKHTRSMMAKSFQIFGWKKTAKIPRRN